MTGDTGSVSDNSGEADEEYVDPNSDYALWMNNAASFLKSISIEPDGTNSNITDNSDYLAWGSSYLLHTFYRGYCATGDMAYLEQLALYLYKIFELMADRDEDGYLNWGASYDIDGVHYPYNEYVVHTGIMVSLAGDFVSLVMGDESLQDKPAAGGMTYSELADYFTDLAVNHAIPAFDKDWNEEIGVYMNRPGSVNYSGSDRKIALPNNQFLAMVPALLSFARVSPEHRELYLSRAERMLQVFRDHIIYLDDGCAIWHYKNTLFKGDWGESVEDYSHAQWSMYAAVHGYSAGMVFSLEDLRAFGKTYDKRMFTGTEEDPRLTMYVNGKKSGDNGNLFLLLYDMSIYGEKFITRGKQYLTVHEQTKGWDAPRILAFHEETPKPRSFELTLPADNAKDVSEGTNVTDFFWQRNAYANYYCLQIAYDPEFTQIVTERNMILESVASAADLPRNAKLYWRVIAKNISGNETVSETFTFSTAK